MKKQAVSNSRHRVNIPAMEADMAFFEARLSLADHAQDTVYQRAQVKAYQTLGKLVGETLETLRSTRRKAVNKDNAAA